jgi:hypothetical protein
LDASIDQGKVMEMGLAVMFVPTIFAMLTAALIAGYAWFLHRSVLDGTQSPAERRHAAGGGS